MGLRIERVMELVNGVKKAVVYGEPKATQINHTVRGTSVSKWGRLLIKKGRVRVVFVGLIGLL